MKSLYSGSLFLIMLFLQPRLSLLSPKQALRNELSEDCNKDLKNLTLSENKEARKLESGNHISKNENPGQNAINEESSFNRVVIPNDPQYQKMDLIVNDIKQVIFFY